MKTARGLEYERKGETRQRFRFKRIWAVYILAFVAALPALIFADDYYRFWTARRSGGHIHDEGLSYYYAEHCSRDVFYGVIYPDDPTSPNNHNHQCTLVRGGIAWKGKKIQYPPHTNIAVIDNAGTISFHNLPDKYFLFSLPEKTEWIGGSKTKAYRWGVDIDAIEADNAIPLPKVKSYGPPQTKYRQ